MVYMKFPARRRTKAMTLPEVLVALLLLGLFLPSVFAVNGVCLRLINATKESTAALQSLHDRCETLRNLAFTDLISASQVQSLMATAANASDFCKNATEVVQISAYPVANGVTQFTRSPGGSVTTNSVATSLGSALVQVTISTSWNATFGGRARSEETTTIISNGTKK
jgi:prepilin-type N-terminal cleavage/methylation domain-containing protein